MKTRSINSGRLPVAGDGHGGIAPAALTADPAALLAIFDAIEHSVDAAALRVFPVQPFELRIVRGRGCPVV